MEPPPTLDAEQELVWAEHFTFLHRSVRFSSTARKTGAVCDLGWRRGRPRLLIVSGKLLDLIGYEQQICVDMEIRQGCS